MSPYFVEPSLVNESILAFDIGNSGGLVSNCFGVLDIRKMPEDLKVLWEYVHNSGATYILAENVHAFSGQGVVSVGTLMKNRGIIEGMCAAYGVTPIFVEPRAWIQCYTLKLKKHFKNKNMWKKYLLEIALAIAPSELHDRLNLNTADAFLIWNWAASLKTSQPLVPYKVSL
jgi:hypothetical protein